MNDETKEKMQKVIDHLLQELASIRSERAHPSLIENIKVDAYEQQMPLKDLATIHASDAQTLTVTIWDIANTKNVDKAVRTAKLSLNPRIEGNILYLAFPPITQERRQDFISIAHEKAEQAKISIRNVRRESNDTDKEQNKNSAISEDDLKNYLKATQTTTDLFIVMIDDLFKKKQASIEKP